MPQDELVKQLRAVRGGYEDERRWHRFLLDAYTGEGGFRGRLVQPPTSYWGPSAQVYADNPTTPRTQSNVEDSYLDRYPREDDHKFNKRLDVAHYPNYVAPLTDLKLSYLLRKKFDLQVSELIHTWRENADGSGRSFDNVKQQVALRAALLGWAPTMVDADPIPVDAETGEPTVVNRQQAEDAGIRPRIVPLFPANILDADSDSDGRLRWAKIRTDHVRRVRWDAKPEQVEDYAIWSPESVLTYRVVTEASSNEPRVEGGNESPNPFGRVPLTVAKHKAAPEASLSGVPMHGDVAIENRRLFNLISELDEHLRSQVFALLIVPQDAKSQKKTLNVGSENAVPVPTDSRQTYSYLAPPASVSTTYETRIESTIREIYRQARVEFSRPQGGGAPESGTAHAYQFAQTNRAIADFAQEIADWEAETYDVVGAYYDQEAGEESTGPARVTPPDSFDIEDVPTEIKNALQALELNLGTRAEEEIKHRVLNRMLPNLDEKTRREIEQQLSEIAERKEQMQAMGSLLGGLAGGGEGGEPDDGGGQPSPAPPQPPPASGGQ